MGTKTASYYYITTVLFVYSSACAARFQSVENIFGVIAGRPWADLAISKHQFKLAKIASLHSQ
jgi:hypothetical protein